MAGRMFALTVKRSCHTLALVTVEGSRPGFQINKEPVPFGLYVWFPQKVQSRSPGRLKHGETGEWGAEKSDLEPL